MRISIELPDDLDAQILRLAQMDGHTNRSAVTRKALLFYLRYMLTKGNIDKADTTIVANNETENDNA